MTFIAKLSSFDAITTPYAGSDVKVLGMIVQQPVYKLAVATPAQVMKEPLSYKKITSRMAMCHMDSPRIGITDQLQTTGQRGEKTFYRRPPVRLDGQHGTHILLNTDRNIVESDSRDLRSTLKENWSSHHVVQPNIEGSIVIQRFVR